MTTVDSINALREFALADNVVTVLGYHTPGDGGGGVFFWENTVTEWVDGWESGGCSPAGIVVRPDPAFGRSAVGGWRREGFRRETSGRADYETCPGPISVKWFGAIGDGVRNDREAIRAAVRAATLIVAPAQEHGGKWTARPTVYFPTGTYAIDDTINVPGLVALGGESGAILTTTGPDIVLVRLAGPNNEVEGLTFLGGRHSIALGGIHRDRDPTACPEPGVLKFSGNVGNDTCLIRSCRFRYPKGPAIWQDTVREEKDSQYHRSFQPTVIVDQFDFVGPHLFWGCCDTIRFQNGRVGWDQSKFAPERSADDLPLGCFNSSGNLVVNDCSLHPLGVGVGGLDWHKRAAWFIGTGSIHINNSRTSDLTGFVFVRQRKNANRYQGAALEAVRLPGDELHPMALTMEGTNIDCSSGTNWLEVYELFPQLIALGPRVPDPPDNFQNSFGIWLDEGLDLETVFWQHKYQQIIRLEGYRYYARAFRIRQSHESLVGVEHGPGIRDLTEAFHHHYDDANDGVGPVPQNNLFHADVYAPGDPARPASGEVRGGRVVDADGRAVFDHRSGFPLPVWSPGGDGKLILKTSPWGISPVMSPGVYVFSFYFKTDYSGQMILVYEHPTRSPPELLSAVNLGDRRFDASAEPSADPWDFGGHYQRIHFSFYYSGGAGGVGYKLAFAISGIPPGGRTAVGLFCINRGPVPAPYLYPLYSLETVPAVPLPPDPPLGNATREGWVRSTYHRAAPPRNGVFFQGDIVYNTHPGPRAPSNVVGWICVASGTPGDWRPFGVLS